MQEAYKKEKKKKGNLKSSKLRRALTWGPCAHYVDCQHNVPPKSFEDVIKLERSSDLCWVGTLFKNQFRSVL